jgi:hypothetical protein
MIFHTWSKQTMSKEAMKLALEALMRIENSLVYSQPISGDEVDEAIAALEEALAKQEPPPMECKTDAEKIAYAFGWFKALELNPAQKPWVGLTHEERNLISRSHAYVDMIIIAAETKLKEKNT